MQDIQNPSISFYLTSKQVLNCSAFNYLIGSIFYANKVHCFVANALDFILTNLKNSLIYIFVTIAYHCKHK